MDILKAMDLTEQLKAPDLIEQLSQDFGLPNIDNLNVTELWERMSKYFCLPNQHSAPCCQSVDVLWSILEDFSSFTSLVKFHKDHEFLKTMDAHMRRWRAKNEILPELQYGCAVLQTVPGDSETDIHISLLAVDNWNFEFQAKQAGGNFFSAPQTSKLFSVGKLGAHLAQDWSNHFTQTLNQAKSKDWQVGAGKKSHQNSPSLILAALHTALSGSPTELPPRGNFTDVGQFFGSKPREVAWPLARALIELMLSSSFDADPVYQRFMPRYRQTEIATAFLLFQTHLLETINATLNVENLDRKSLDNIQSIWTHLALEGAKLSDLDHDVSFLVSKLTASRQHVVELLDAQNQSNLRKWVLPMLSADSPVLPVSLMVPEPTSSCLKEMDPALVREEALKALGSFRLPLPNPESMGCQDMLNWFNAQGHDLAAAMVALERWFVANSVCLEDFPTPIASQFPVELLGKLLEDYNASKTKFLQTDAAQQLMMVEECSIQTLVNWIGYSLLHRVIGEEIPLITQYGVALDPHLLHHLTLSNRVDELALWRVASYLQRNTTSKPLFKTSEPAHMLEFAQAYAPADARFVALHSHQELLVAQRITDLHKRIRAAHVALEEAEAQYNVAVANHTKASSSANACYHTDHWSYNCPLAYAEKNAHAVEQSCQNAVEKRKKAPSDLYANQPISTDATISMVQLFFLYMPPRLALLLKVGLEAQSLMVGDVCIKPTIPHGSRDYIQYFNGLNNQYRGEVSSPSPLLQLHFSTVPLSGPIHGVGTLTRAYPRNPNSQHNGSIGIWYQQERPQLIAVQADPFALPPDSDKLLTQRWSSKFPAKYSTWNWVIPAFSDPDLARGNQAIARPELPPFITSLEQWQAFCSLRAMPMLQIRKIMNALRDRSLPLGDPNVQLLIRQALFQLGPFTIDSNSPLSFEYRRDLVKLGGYELLVRELEGLLEEYSEKIRDHQPVLLICELVAYLAQYPDAKTIARRLRARCVEVLLKWHDMIGEEVQEMLISPTVPQKDIELKRLQQGLFCMYGIIAYSGSDPLQESEIVNVVRLQCGVRSRHGILMDPSSHYWVFIKPLLERIRMVMIHRIRDVNLAWTFVSNRDRALHSLLAIFEPGLATSTQSWAQLTDEATGNHSGCYDITCGGNHVCLNALSGLILVNGKPSASLPSSILNNPTYQRSFGVRDFEVQKVIDARGIAVLRTRPLGKVIFEFDHPTPELLTISEIPIAASDIGELILDRENALELLHPKDPWIESLDIRLKLGHSHWLHRPSLKLLFRGVNFTDTAFQFIGIPQSQEQSFPSKLAGKEIDSVADTNKVHSEVEEDDEAGNHAVELVNRLVALELAAPSSKETESNVDGEIDIHARVIDSSIATRFIAGDDEQAESLVGIFSLPQPLTWASYNAISQNDQVAVMHQLVDSSEIAELRSILSKLERRELVHAWSHCQSRQVHIDIPRFRLQFDLVGGKLWSRDFRGYLLSPCQQLDGALRGFTQYLLLQPSSDSACSKVIIPLGRAIIGANDEPLVEMEKSLDPLSSQRFYVYDIHPRFKELRTRTVAGRLHLSSIYGACSSMMTEPMSQMTGEENALQLLQGCFVDRPLDKDEMMHLDAILSLCWRVPAVPIAARGLLDHSQSLIFLHDPAFAGLPATKSEMAPSELVAHSDFSSRYSLYKSEFPFANGRQLLSPHQETLLLGIQREIPLPSRPIGMQKGSIHADLGLASTARSCRQTYIESELAVLKLVEWQESASTEATAFPLKKSSFSDSELAQDMLNDLERTWNAHISSKRFKFLLKVDTARDELVRISEALVAPLSHLESSLYALLRSVPKDDSPLAWHMRSFQLFNGAGCVADLKITDFISFLWNSELIGLFNPFLVLHNDDMEAFKEAIIVWMELAVLQEKIDRLMALCSFNHSNDTELQSKFAKEAMVVRSWDPRKHPKWIAFELCARLQIRPNQYIIAKEMMANPGALCQLNMGEGKTRVILPMLLMEMSERARLEFGHEPHKRAIPRIHILPQLMVETFNYMHECLCGGILNQRLMSLPFSRDVELDSTRMRAIRKHIAGVQSASGVIFMTPSSRLSMILKAVELEKKGETQMAFELSALNDKLEWRDVYDEADAVLSHKFQLVYASGSPEMLPDLDQRFIAIYTLLFTLMSQRFRERFFSKNPNVFKVEETKSRRGSWPLFQLIAGPDLDSVTLEFNQALAKELYESAELFRELRGVPKTIGLDDFVSYVTDKTRHSDTICEVSEKRPLLLAFRGMLAFGVLKHALSMQYCVNFGLDITGTRKKRLAIPYLACDAPSVASDFAHPDVALLLSAVSYFFNGLTDAQVVEAFRHLLSLGESAQRNVYQTWFDTSFENPGESEKPINLVSKIDLTNASMVALLQDSYRFNRLVIAFWLKYCVLPKDTAQFEGRIQTSAWHLVEHGERPAGIGFSGTNDRAPLMPLQVKQHEIRLESSVDEMEVCRVKDEPSSSHIASSSEASLSEASSSEASSSSNADSSSLDDKDPLAASIKHHDRLHRLNIVGTNGKMLDLMMHHAEVEMESIADSHHLIRKCARLSMLDDRGCAALIDGGGLLAGSSNEKAAKSFLEMTLEIAQDPSVGASIHHKLAKGVIYFGRKGWMVLDRNNIEISLEKSAILPMDCFVIFDQQRCRGADFKLSPTAMAVLTLGFKMCKDDLMQAAGRMRSLGISQKLLLVAHEEVLQDVRQFAAAYRGSEVAEPEERCITSLDVLGWSVACTARTCEHGLYEHLEHGVAFLKTQQDRSQFEVPELVALSDMYLEEERESTVFHVIQDSLASVSSSSSSVAQGGENGLIRVNSRRERLEGYSRQIDEAGARYGKTTIARLGGANEECQRELEREAEQEEEKEVQYVLYKPHQEVDWSFGSVWAPSAHSLSILQASRAAPIATLFPRLHYSEEESPASVTWIPTASTSDADLAIANSPQSPQIFLSQNFWSTAQASSHLNSLLRTVDALLVLPDTSILLVTDREASGMIGAYWSLSDSQQAEGRVRLLHLSSLRSTSISEPRPLQLPTPSQLNGSAANLSAGRLEELVSLILLFGGSTNFHLPQRLTFLQSAIPNATAQAGALFWSKNRGLRSTIFGSDLEQLCGVEGQY
jgi:hypothetical protein